MSDRLGPARVEPNIHRAVDNRNDGSHLNRMLMLVDRLQMTFRSARLISGD